MRVITCHLLRKQNRKQRASLLCHLHRMLYRKQQVFLLQVCQLHHMLHHKQQELQPFSRCPVHCEKN